MFYFFALQSVLAFTNFIAYNREHIIKILLSRCDL